MHRLWLWLGGRSLCGSPARRKSGIFFVHTSAFISYERNDDEARDGRAKRNRSLLFVGYVFIHSLPTLISDFTTRRIVTFWKIKYEYQSRKHLSYNGEPRVLIASSFCLRVLCEFTLDSYMQKLVCVLVI